MGWIISYKIIEKHILKIISISDIFIHHKNFVFLRFGIGITHLTFVFVFIVSLFTFKLEKSNRGTFIDEWKNFLSNFTVTSRNNEFISPCFMRSRTSATQTIREYITSNLRRSSLLLRKIASSESISKHFIS